MISRERPTPVVVRERPSQNDDSESRPRLRKIGETCEKIWKHLPQNPTISDLESAIRKANITAIPDNVDDDAIAAMIMHGKQGIDLKDFIRKHGMTYFNTLKRISREKVEVLFEEIRKIHG